MGVCWWKGHNWSPWRMWYLGALNDPRIAFASFEYLKDSTKVRACTRCGKREAQP